MDSVLDGQLGGIVVATAVLVVILYLSTRIVKEHERMVVFRLGRTSPELVREPGLRIVFPFIDRVVKVDMREQFVEVSPQRVISKDDLPADIAFLVYYRIVDAMTSVVAVTSFEAALEGIAVTTLRATMSELSLDDVLRKPATLDRRLRRELDEQVKDWGGTVTQVEIREIAPAPDVMEALSRLDESPATPTARLAELDKAHDAGLISDEEYQAARRAILVDF